MTLANVFHAWSASKSGRNLLDVNVMLSLCSVHLFYVWALLLCHNVWHVAGLKGGKELDNAIIQTIGGEKAADVWVPRFVFNHKTICAGVTLTAEADLTSATCLNDDEPLEAFVVVESHGQDEPPVQVAHIDSCVKFDKDQQHVHDLMVCFHQCQWNFSDYVFVPRINLESDRDGYREETCSVMGFGHMTPEGDKCNVLHTMEIHMGTSQDCGSQDNSVQNYICGATAEQQESCVVDSGEPLLCQHNSSKFLIHGICKQEYCSAPQKYSKFLLLSYYREWLERTVPELASSSRSQEVTSSLGEEEEQKTDGKAGDMAPEQNRKKMERTEDESEKCPVLTHPPPVHIHNHSPARKEHLGRTTSANSDGTYSSSVAPNTPHSGDGDAGVDAQNTGETVRQPISSAEMPLADQQDSSGEAQPASSSGVTHHPSLLEASAGGDGSDSNAELSAVASLPSSEAPHNILSAVGSRDVAGNTSREESLPNSVLAKESDSGNSDLVNSVYSDASPADDEDPPTTTPVQLSSEDSASVVPSNSADGILNVTVLLTSLADGWYLSNATHSAPHLSGNNQTIDLSELEKAISVNGALLNFSYVVDGSNLSLPGYRKRSIETVPKVHSLPGNELAKSGADSPNSILSNQMKLTGLKSQGSVEKTGQITVDSVKPQNVLPSDGVTPIQETDRDVLANVSHTDGPHDTASSSAALSQNLSTELPHPPKYSQPAVLNTLTLSPSQWDWLKQNAMRIPKNPLQNPKILGKTLLFKKPQRKDDTLSRARFAEEYWNRSQNEMSDSEDWGFPSNYREKWSGQVMSYSRPRPSSNNFENRVKSMQTDPSRLPGNGLLKSGVSIKTVRDKKFQSMSSVPQVIPSGFHNSLKAGRAQRSLTSKETYSRKADHHPADTQIRGNSPIHTAELTERGPSLSPSTNSRQPEGTFFGVVTSSIRNRLKRSGVFDGRHDKPADRNTLLADLASWPARVGIASSQLTPHVSFLTAVNETDTEGVGAPPAQSFYLYFKVMRAFLPGGNAHRRLEMYKKKLLWGPPITYDEFQPLKPGRMEFGEEKQNRAHESEVGVRVDAEENTTSSTVVPEVTENKQGSSEGSTTGTAAEEHVSRQVREVKNDFPTTPGAGIQHEGDDDIISADLGMESEIRTAGHQNSSYSGLPNGATVSSQPDSGIPVGTADTEKQITLSTVDTRKETTLPTVDTQKETTLSTADTQKNTLLSTIDAEKETTDSTVGTQREVTVSTTDSEKKSTRSTLTVWPTVKRKIVMQEPYEEKYSASFTHGDGNGEALKVPEDSEDQNQEQQEFYGKIKRLGADGGSNATQKLSSVVGVALTLVLTWISMPQI